MRTPTRSVERPRQVADDQGFLASLVGDGVLALLAVAGSLVFAGVFLVSLGLSGQFLPHDVGYLGVSPQDLCGYADCRIVDFMIHDRVAFGGALFAIGVLYAYLVLFPLRNGEPWAWWALVASGLVGFGSFLAYLSYGYLDGWHAVGTLLLLPVYAIGLVRSRHVLAPSGGPLSLVAAGRFPDLVTRAGLGRMSLLAGAGGTAIGGLTILWVGLTSIFVPQDLTFIGLSAERLDEINERLVPLIAHDRAGFGGAVLTLGLTTAITLWCSSVSRALWEALLCAGTVALAAAIGIHFAVGYTDPWHLAPVVAAAGSMVIGLTLTWPSLRSGSAAPGSPRSPVP